MDISWKCQHPRPYRIKLMEYLVRMSIGIFPKLLSALHKMTKNWKLNNSCYVSAG